jgi:hypothetical protein
MEFTSIDVEERCPTGGQPVQLIQRLTGLAGTASSAAPVKDCQSLEVRNDADRKQEVATDRQTYRSASLSTTNTTWTVNVFNGSAQVFRIRKVCCPWMVTYRIRQQRATTQCSFKFNNYATFCC